MATVDYGNDVQKLYVAYFGRPADPAGLAFWTNALQNNPNGYQAMSSAFSMSLEYRATYAGLGNRALVTEVYDNLFGRVAEAAGVDYWANALDNGAIGFDNVVTQIAAGAQGLDRQIYNGKVAVSTSFTARVDTDVEKAAYSGAAANRIAIDYIDGVRDIVSAAQRIDPGQIDATIARIVGTPTAIGFDDMGLV